MTSQASSIYFSCSKEPVVVFRFHSHPHTHHTQCRICKECGSIVSPMLDKAPPTSSALSDVQPEWRCRMCQDKGQIDIISVPYVFRYLVAELAAMNIKVQLEIS